MQTVTQNKTRNISISLSSREIEILDDFSKKERLPRSKLVSNALDFFIKNKINEELKKAYIEDGDDDIEFANNSLVSFNEIL